jgi:hypothetical protein
MSRNAELMESNFQIVLDKVFSWPEARKLYRLRARAQSFLYQDVTWIYFDEGRRLRALDRILRSLLLWPLPSGRYYPRGDLRSGTELATRFRNGSKTGSTSGPTPPACDWQSPCRENSRTGSCRMVPRDRPMAGTR